MSSSYSTQSDSQADPAFTMQKLPRMDLVVLRDPIYRRDSHVHQCLQSGGRTGVLHHVDKLQGHRRRLGTGEFASPFVVETARWRMQHCSRRPLRQGADWNDRLHHRSLSIRWEYDSAENRHSSRGQRCHFLHFWVRYAPLSMRDNVLLVLQNHWSSQRRSIDSTAVLDESDERNLRRSSSSASERRSDSRS